MHIIPNLYNALSGTSIFQTISSVEFFQFLPPIQLITDTFALEGDNTFEEVSLSGTISLVFFKSASSPSIFIGEELYSLYWEGKNDVKHDLTEGFIVEGKNAASFLEEKLEILGLNPREKQEFIIYWLPELEANGLNYIRFETKEQIDEDMPLIVEPKPDTVIRIMMVIKKINKPIEVKQQELTKVERKGFTVVEWGGTRI